MDTSRFSKLRAFLAQEAQHWCFLLGIVFLPASLLIVFVDYQNHHDIFLPGSEIHDAVGVFIVWGALAIALGAISWPRREKRGYAMAGMACAAVGLAIILGWNDFVTNSVAPFDVLSPFPRN